MTALQRRLLTTWLSAVAAVVLIVVAHDWPHIWWLLSSAAVIAVLVERPLLEQVYSVAPTPIEYFSERPLWKAFALWYGILLAVTALSLLTFAQSLAQSLSENLPLLFIIILAPLAFPIAFHQLAVFRALAHEPDA